MQRMGLDEATTEVLKLSGVHILHHPARFVGSVQDLIQTDSDESTVLYDHCNEDFLKRYDEACGKGTPDALKAAYLSGVSYLTERKFLNAGVAEKVSGGLVRGIANYLGVSVKLPERSREVIVAEPPKGPVRHPNVIEPAGNVGGGHVVRPGSGSGGAGRGSGGTGRGAWSGGSGSVSGSGSGGTTYYPRSGSGGSGSGARPGSGGTRVRGSGGATYYPPSGSGGTSVAPRPGASAGLAPLPGLGGSGSRGSRAPGAPVVVPMTPAPPTSSVLGGVNPAPKPARWPKILLTVSLSIFVGVLGYLVFTGSLFRTGGGDVVVSFDENGAAQDSIEDIATRAGARVDLPSGTSLARAGYRFAGWGTKRVADEVFTTSVTPSESLTLYAQWELDGDVTYTEVDSYIKDSDDGSTVAVVVLKNDSQATVDFHAVFSFLDSSGAEVASDEAVAYSVGPGDTTLLQGDSSLGGITSMRTQIVPTPTEYGPTSIVPLVQVQELSRDANGYKVSLTNKGDKDVTLLSCVAVGNGTGGEFAYSPVAYEKDSEDRRLAAGASREVTFGGSLWQVMDNYQVYVYGYAK